MDDAAESAASAKIAEQFPIFRVQDRYLLFDVEVITHIRRQYHICGVLIGNIPIAAQQNVFSGIPLELMPEEARLLVEHLRVAFVVNDVLAHDRMRELDPSTRKQFLDHVEVKKVASALRAKEVAESKKKAYFEKIEQAKTLGLQKQRKRQQAAATSSDAAADDNAESFFGTIEAPKASSVDGGDAAPKVEHRESADLAAPSDVDRAIVPHEYTPTTSYPPLIATATETSQSIPEATTGYYLFAYLHSKGYFMSPGLRFGCNFVAYPGDPLRYHSHFLSVSKGWDEPIDLLDIVGGGRLGTGVKKGYLVGGVQTADKDTKQDLDVDNVRLFCFEWAAM